MLSSKDPENIELLCGDAKRLKKLMLSPHQPVRCEEKVYSNLLVDVPKTRAVLISSSIFIKKRREDFRSLLLLQPQFIKLLREVQFNVGSEFNFLADHKSAADCIVRLQVVVETIEFAYELEAGLL